MTLKLHADALFSLLRFFPCVFSIVTIIEPSHQRKRALDYGIAVAYILRGHGKEPLISELSKVA